MTEFRPQSRSAAALVLEFGPDSHNLTAVSFKIIYKLDVPPFCQNKIL